MPSIKASIPSLRFQVWDYSITSLISLKQKNSFIREYLMDPPISQAWDYSIISLISNKPIKKYFQLTPIKLKGSLRSQPDVYSIISLIS